MENLKSFLLSGILESYVLGNTTIVETDLVEEMARDFNEIRDEIASINDALELYALSNALKPDPVIRPFLLASIDFTERMKGGEQPSFPPELNDHSIMEDYAEWLNRPDMMLPPDYKDYYAKIIGYTPSAITAIVWIREMAPQEVHHNEYEKFLVVEGTCSITIDGKVHNMVPGNYLSIPLHKKHSVEVTSDMPCKAILQRIAA